MIKKNRMKIGPSKLDKFLHSARVIVNRFQSKVATYLLGFLTGILINVVSGSDLNILKTFPRNVVIEVSVVVLIILPILRYSLEWHYRKTRWESWFAKFLVGNVDPLASPFAKDVLAWDKIITISQCPDLNEGWRLSDVRIVREHHKFEIPVQWEESYKHYFNENYHKKRFFNDGTKFMLTKNPRTFTDTPTLELDIKETRYSVVLFYREQIWYNHSDVQKRMIDDFVKSEESYPQALGMQVVVITSDNMILATRRSPKVEHDPSTWSVSLEEQLSADKDFDGDARRIVLRWGKRLLEEELGIDEEQYDEDNLRILTVMLECYIVNCSLFGVFRLAITAKELDNRIKSMVRKDYEFQDWKFITFEQLITELRSPSHDSFPLHPSSGYRMLLVLAHKYGIPGLAERLFGIEI